MSDPNNNNKPATPAAKPKGNPLAAVAAQRRQEYQARTGVTSNTDAEKRAQEYRERRRLELEVEKEKAAAAVRTDIVMAGLDQKTKREDKEWAEKLRKQVEIEKQQREQEEKIRLEKIEKIRQQKAQKEQEEAERLRARREAIANGTYQRPAQHKASNNGSNSSSDDDKQTKGNNGGSYEYQPLDD